LYVILLLELKGRDMNLDELAETLKQKYTDDRSHGVTKIDLKKYENIYFVVSPAPPLEINKSEIPFKILGKALSVLGSLPSFKEMDELDQIINYLFVRREVVQSSRLEGTWSTIDHALTPGSIAHLNEGKDEHQAVRSYANLLDGIIERTLDQKEKVFNIALIQEIQSRIVENDPNSKGIPGKLRSHGDPGSVVTIGGIRAEDSKYNPNPASTVRVGLKNVLAWLKDEEFTQKGDAGLGLSLPIRLAIGHSHFEAVHPFTDGNGRTGRAIWPLQMVCSGHMPLYLSGYVEEYKYDYGKALEAAQKKLNYGPMIEFICNAIIDCDLEARQTKEAIQNLGQKWASRGKFKKGSAAKNSLILLLSTPIINAKLLEVELGVSSTVAADTIKALLAKKIIKFRKIENRKRVYAAEELILILSRPYGSEIDLALEKASNLLGL